MSTQSFCWRVERFSHFKGHLYVQGWAFHQEFQLKTLYVELPNGKRVKTKGYGLASPDVEAVHGDQASKCRFSLRVALPDAAAAAAGDVGPQRQRPERCHCCADRRTRN